MVAPVPDPTIVALTGRASRSTVEAHLGWDRSRAPEYEADPTALARIRRAASDVEIILFIGTWCPDCKREVPRFFRIMDLAGIPEDRLTIIGLDRSKKDAEGLTARWNVGRVPTFVFVRNGRELARIVERPNGSLESDIAAILKENSEDANDLA
ncbi:MAG: thioredoxin family protein [Chloroflexi bacterium]|nr:thioredoxin family protein [Chloroflexota bacterium]